LEDTLEMQKQLLAISDSSPGPVYVCAGEDFKVIYANDATLIAWDKDRSVIGKPFVEAIPEIVDQPYSGLLKQVYTTGIAFFSEQERADLPVNGVLQTFHYKFSYQPLKNNEGDIWAVLCVATDVTELVMARKQVELTNSNLRSMIMQSPVAMAILIGADYIIQVANTPMFKLWGIPSEFLNRPVFEGLKHLKANFEPLLDKVYYKGETVSFEELPIEFPRDGVFETSFVNFSYQPIIELDGSTSGILVVAIDVTSQVLSRRKIEQAELKTQRINEELTNSNEELSVANEELVSVQANLQSTINKLHESQTRFFGMIKSSPVAMALTMGEDFIFEEINEAMLEIINRDSSVKGKSIFEVLPELKEQPVADILRQAFYTGKEYKLLEEPTMLIHEGQLQFGYYNITYKPVVENGTVTGVMHSAVDVTEHVNSRKKAEDAEEDLRLAIESAELGTWSIEGPERKFRTSARFKEIFGFDPDEELSYDKAMMQIPEDHRIRVDREANASMSLGEPFSTEYPLSRFNDGKLRWVRSVGKPAFYSDDTLNTFTGVIHDITEQKLDEQRKNDFIGMVSHELKTPLTSMNGYIQILHGKAAKTSDSFNIGILEKARNQVNKMTTMINGFLNVSRLESGKIHINKQIFDMADLMKETEDETLATISSHRVYFHPVISTIVNADRDKIGQVINNLLSNAVKYSPSDTTIQVACVTDNGNAVVSVRDEGIGIQILDIDKLFRRYYRVEGNPASAIGGFGIGLYLCEEIINRHNGKIWVESEIGKGSTFYFSLSIPIT
jgi:PAS domain S-box-containing protein